MNSRERVKAAIRYLPPDRLPCNESLWEETADHWRKQGMPSDVEVEDLFGFDICGMSIDASPRFEQRVLEHTGPFVVYEDRFGYTIRKFVEKTSTSEFFNHKTTNRDAWTLIKERFVLSSDPHETARIDDASYFAHQAPYPSWNEAVGKYQRIYASNRYMLFNAYGPWEATWRHRGYENQLRDVLVDPDWLTEMAGTYVDLLLAVLERCLSLGMRPDGFFMVEDLAFNRGLLIDPESWRKVFKPATAKIGNFLASHDIDFWMHCCGFFEPILEDLIECGVQVIQPLQVIAGWDIRKIFGKYQGRLAFYGNISIANMLGSADELQREITTKVDLARRGGYIFHSDHSMPPQVGYQHYCWMLELARERFAHGPRPA